MNNRFSAVLSIRSFLFLWLAEVFSQISMNMTNFVLIIVAYKLSSSNTAVSGIVLSFTIPAILFGMLAGVYGDRWNKKNVLFSTNIIRMILLVLLAVFYKNLLLVYTLSFVIAIVTQFFIPAETPIIPRLVPKKLLLTANALFGMGIYGSIFVAYALSGPFFILLGETYLFFLLGFFYAVAALFISFIKIPQKNIALSKIYQHKEITLVSEMKKAFTLMIRTKDIYQSLLLLTLSQILILILAVIGPGYASQILNIKVEDFPLLFVTPSTIGMLVGAILLGNFFDTKLKYKSATIGVFLAGIAMLFLPYGSKVASRDIIHSINAYLPHILTITILHIMVFLAFVLGFANALVFVPSNTILQEKTSDEFRGKVYGTLNALVGISSLLPIIIVGELADIFGVGKVITGIGISILCIAFLRLMFHLKLA